MKFRIGVVGAGSIAVESHLPILKSLKKVEVSAIYDKRFPVAEEVASQFGVKTFFSGLKEMFARAHSTILNLRQQRKRVEKQSRLLKKFAEK